MCKYHLWTGRVIAIAICTIFLAGCKAPGVSVNIVIGGSDGPTSIYLAPEADKEEIRDSEPEGGPAVKNKYESDIGPYYEMEDGTWMFDGKSYKYRLEITGRLNSATVDSTFIYLSNIKDISFERAAMASGLSSNMVDYFSPDEAVFIGWKEE